MAYFKLYNSDARIDIVSLEVETVIPSKDFIVVGRSAAVDLYKRLPSLEVTRASEEEYKEYSKAKAKRVKAEKALAEAKEKEAEELAKARKAKAKKAAANAEPKARKPKAKKTKKSTK